MSTADRANPGSPAGGPDLPIARRIRLRPRRQPAGDNLRPSRYASCNGGGGTVGAQGAQYPTHNPKQEKESLKKMILANGYCEFITRENQQDFPVSSNPTQISDFTHWLHDLRVPRLTWRPSPSGRLFSNGRVDGLPRELPVFPREQSNAPSALGLTATRVLSISFW
jgi:hypothetical protein